MLFTQIKPMIVSVGREPFDDERFIFEPKWDGWRLLLHKQGNRIEAYTSNGTIVSSKFPELLEASDAINVHSAILDCEGIVLREGRPVFDDFSYRGRLSRSSTIKNAVNTHPVTFIVFDVLFTGREHVLEPLMLRKQLLSEIVSATPVISPTLYIETQGKNLFNLTRDGDMEGIVAKRKESKNYLGATSPDWLKIKHFKTIDVMILGYRDQPLELVIGLIFRTVPHKPVGTVKLSSHPAEKEYFMELAEQLHTVKDQRTQWIEPRLCCRIEYLERTDTHQLKTTVFREFLLDKQPEECNWTYQ